MLRSVLHASHIKVVLCGLMMSGAIGPTALMSSGNDDRRDHALHVMGISANNTRLVMSNDEFVPRYANIVPNSLIVPAGQVVTLPHQATYDAIEVAGTLRVDPSGQTTLRVTNLQVLPGGHLDWNVPCGAHLEVILRSVAIDTRIDPYQWGHGILNFGTETIRGCERGRSFTTAATDISAGATSIRLTTLPAGWSVGDELVIPDTRQQDPYENLVRKNVAHRESKVTIAQISGNIVGLSKPLDYEHAAIRGFDGNIILQPRVANITRNVVIRSEDPAGVPGHTASIGDLATWDMRYVEFRNLGRTQNVAVDSTPPDVSRVGTNQAGRYAVHFHHAQGYQSKFIGNAVVGHPAAGKWGVVLHRVSDSLVEDNAVVGFTGAGFVTEDGPEVRNIIRGNFAAYMDGGPDPRQGTINMPEANNSRGCVACEGAGFWFKGMEGTVFEKNEAWNTRFGEVFMDFPVFDRYPERPGGPVDTALPHRSHWFASHADNVTAANLTAGLDLWRTTATGIIDRHVSAHNWPFQVILGGVPIAEGGSYIRNSTVLCRGDGAKGLVFPRPYSFILRVENTSVLGCTVGLAQGGAKDLLLIDGGTWQNEVNFDLTSAPLGTVRIANAGVKPFPSTLSRAFPAPPAETNGLNVLYYNDKHPWLPGGTASSDLSRCKQAIVNWLGTGRNYCLMENP